MRHIGLILLGLSWIPGAVGCGSYGSFRDYGLYGATRYAGHSNLPAGYWVYRFPYWYLWRSLRP